MKAKVTVVFHLEYEVLDRNEGEVEFFIEENHCHDNYVRHLARMIDADPYHCQTCTTSKALVGHIPFADIRSARDRSKAE